MGPVELPPNYPELAGMQPVESVQVPIGISGRSIEVVQVQENVTATTSQFAEHDLSTGSLVGESLGLLAGDSGQKPLPSFVEAFGYRLVSGHQVQENVTATTSQFAEHDLSTGSLVGESLGLLAGDSGQKPLPSFVEPFGYRLVSGHQVQENVLETASSSESDSTAIDDEDSNSLGGADKTPSGAQQGSPLSVPDLQQGLCPERRPDKT